MIEQVIKPLVINNNERMLMAITPQHFVIITKYVVHFVAQSLLFATVLITRFRKNAQNVPFSQVLSHMF